MTFAINDPDETVREIIAQQGLTMIILKDQQDHSYITGMHAVVLDGYWFDIDYVRAIKEKGVKVIQIDDVSGDEFYADIIINHAIGADYKNSQIKKNQQFLTGMQYAMLRMEFLTYKKKTGQLKNRITINLGGADPLNYTQKLLLAVLKQEKIDQYKISVLLGNAYRFKSDLLKMIESYPLHDIEILQGIDAKGIVNLFDNTRLLICASSTIIYEALAVGVPIACFLTADNQLSIYEGLLSCNSVEGLGNLSIMSEEELEKAIKNLVLNYNKILNRSLNQENIIDGRSGERIKKAIDSLWS